ncbi:MAG TPA: zinc ABC transporter substrate-binding protein [Bacteroides sp.]|nr:zinc ABC transporter substrate-binding protein [Bacteroides sp.]
MRNWIIAGFCLALLGSCSPGAEESDKPVISVTILPQQYFVEKIGGDLFRVNVMIPPGASPATYEPTISQLSELDRSDLYMKIGYLGFELSWMEKIMATNPAMKLVSLSDNIDLIREENPAHLHGHNHGGIDPHIWMSPLNAKIIATTVYRELLLLMPEEKVFLEERHETFQAELDSLHATITSMLSSLEDRSFMTYHPSLSYYARDYDLEQIPLEIGGKSPSPTHMKWMTDVGREKGISLIFLQMQLDQKDAETLAKEIGAEIIQINPLDPDWYSQMLFITGKLVSD